MRHPRHKPLVDKAVSACLAAIEIYNKVLFPHREETFAILMVNAWELLLKARLVKEAGKMSAIYETAVPKKKSGEQAKRQKVQIGASKNPRTIGISRALHLCGMLPTMAVPAACADNVRALIEIRDNACHLLNEDRDLSQRVWEIGTGSLRNFLSAARDWFGRDLSEHRIFMMPLAFVQPGEVAGLAKGRTKAVANLAEFLDRMDKTYSGVAADAPFVLSLRLEARLVGSRHADAQPVRLTNDPNAPELRIAEEDWRKHYPMNYEALRTALSKRYIDFKANPRFHALKKQAEKEGRLAHRRPFDPYNPKNQVKTFYSPGVLDFFDKHYTRLLSGQTPPPSSWARVSGHVVGKAGKA